MKWPLAFTVPSSAFSLSLSLSLSRSLSLSLSRWRSLCVRSQSFKWFVLICQTLYHLMLFCGNLFFISPFHLPLLPSLSGQPMRLSLPLCLVKWNNWIVNRTIKYFIVIRFLLDVIPFPPSIQIHTPLPFCLPSSVNISFSLWRSIAVSLAQFESLTLCVSTVAFG